jgi:hypothetical protein
MCHCFQNLIPNIVYYLALASDTNHRTLILSNGQTSSMSNYSRQTTVCSASVGCWGSRCMCVYAMRMLGVMCKQVNLSEIPLVCQRRNRIWTVGLPLCHQSFGDDFIVYLVDDIPGPPYRHMHIQMNMPRNKLSIIRWT